MLHFANGTAVSKGCAAVKSSRAYVSQAQGLVTVAEHKSNRLLLLTAYTIPGLHMTTAQATIA